MSEVPLRCRSKGGAGRRGAVGRHNDFVRMSMTTFLSFQVEGRSWPTRHRGRLWIASTVRPPPDAEVLYAIPPPPPKKIRFVKCAFALGLRLRIGVWGVECRGAGRRLHGVG